MPNLAASGSRVEWYYVVEETDGTISATIPNFTPIRFNTSGVSRTTTQVDSAEINPDRQRVKSRQGTSSIAGDIVFELSYGSHDGLFEAMFQNTFATDQLIVGSTVATLALLRRNKDTGVDMLYRGNRVSDMALAVVIDASAIVTMSVIGTDEELYTVPVGATFDAATTSDMMVPTIGYLNDNAVALNYITDYSITMTNGMNPLFALFDRGAYSVENGIFAVTGTMSAYQPDDTLITKFLDETATDHVLKLQDISGNYYTFTMPDMLYIELSDPVSGPGAHIHAYTFTAGFDGTSTITLDRSA
jgi:hypothetical protein